MQDLHQFDQLLAQLHDPSALRQFLLHISLAQHGKARDEGIGGEPVPLRLGKQIALDITCATLKGKAQLRFGFHAFGDDPASGFFRHLRQGAHHLAARATQCRGLEQAHIQLEDIRAQGQDPIQLRIPGAEIINGNSCARLTIAGDDFGQALAVATQLGDLKHDAFWIDAMGLQLFQAGQGLSGSQQGDPAWRDIKAQKPVFRCFMQAAQGIVTDLAVQAA